MQGYKELPPEQRRGYFTSLLKQELMANLSLRSVYANWTPNGLDGIDSEYASTPDMDETGRFIPAWIRRDNELLLTHIVGFSWELCARLPGIAHSSYSIFYVPMSAREHFNREYV
jgi:hypothetical protein